MTMTTMMIIIVLIMIMVIMLMMMMMMMMIMMIMMIMMMIEILIQHTIAASSHHTSYKILPTEGKSVAKTETLRPSINLLTLQIVMVPVAVVVIFAILVSAPPPAVLVSSELVFVQQLSLFVVVQKLAGSNKYMYTMNDHHTHTRTHIMLTNMFPFHSHP